MKTDRYSNALTTYLTQMLGAVCSGVERVVVVSGSDKTGRRVSEGEFQPTVLAR